MDNDFNLNDPNIRDFYFISFFSNSIIKVSKNRIDLSTVPRGFHINEEKHKFKFHLGGENYRCMICPESYSKQCTVIDHSCKFDVKSILDFKRHINARSSLWNVRLCSLNDDLEIPTGRLLGDVKTLYNRNKGSLDNLEVFNGESFVKINGYSCIFKKCHCENKLNNGLAQLLNHIAHLETTVEKRIMVREIRSDDQDGDNNVVGQSSQVTYKRTCSSRSKEANFKTSYVIQKPGTSNDQLKLTVKRKNENDGDKLNQMKRKMGQSYERDNSKLPKQRADEEIRREKEIKLLNAIKTLEEEREALLMTIKMKNEETMKNQKRISDLEDALKKIRTEMGRKIGEEIKLKEEEIKNRDIKIDDLNEKLNDKTEHNKILIKANDKKNEEIIKHQKKISDLQDDLKEMQIEMERKVNDEIKSKEEEIKSRDLKIDKLNEKLITKEEKNDQLLLIVGKQNDAANEYQKKISDLEDSLKKMEKSLNSNEKTINICFK